MTNSNKKTNNVSSVRPGNIKERHWLELTEGSGIDPAVVKANEIYSLNGHDPLYTLNVAKNGKELNSNGTFTPEQMAKYSSLCHGGWWIGTIALNFNGSVYSIDKSCEWGQFKPDHPRQEVDRKTGKTKTIKYDSPPGQPTRAFLLRPSQQSWTDCVNRFGADGSRKRIPTNGKAANLTVKPQKLEEFWIWVANSHVPIIICEGAKKAMALLSQGYAAIALPGIFGGYRNHELKIADLRELHADLKPFMNTSREWYFCFDAETKPNTIKNVNIAIERTGKLIKKANTKNKVKVISLPVPKKFGDKSGVDDFIVVNGADSFHALFNNAPTLLEWVAAWTRNLTINESKYLEVSGDLLDEVNGKKYLPRNLFSLVPQHEQLIGVRAPKGAGKTETLPWLIDQAVKEGSQPLLLGHRVLLGKSLANRIGITYLSDITTEEQKSKAIRFGMGLCIDSLHSNSAAKFNLNEWQNITVVIDEAEQVIDHLLFARTAVRDNRSQIIANFGESLKKAVLSGGKIIAMDADLTDLSLNFIRNLIKERLGPEIEPFIVDGGYELKLQETKQCYFYDDTKSSHWLANLQEFIKNNGRAYICTDAKKPTSKYGTEGLERRLKNLFPELRILRVDSETTKDEKHPAFGIAERINEEIVSWDVIITSPSLGTGVSIDVRSHFHGVFGTFCGAITPEQACQQMGRVRENVIRHLWVAKVGLKRIAGGFTTIRALKAHSKYNFDGIIETLKESANCFWDDESERHIGGAYAALDTYHAIALRTNASTAEYRDSVGRCMIEDGFDLLDPEPPDGDLVKQIEDEMQRNKEELDAEDSARKAGAEGVDDYVNSVPMENTIYGFIERSAIKFLSEQRKIDKYQESKLKLVANYLVPTQEITPEFVDLDKKGMYGQLKFDYWLTIGREFLGARDFKVLDRALASGQGYLPDMNRDTTSPKVKAFIESGTLELFQKLTEKQVFRSDDDLIIDWADKFKDYNKIEQSAKFGFTVGFQEDAIKCFGKALKIIGYKLKCTKRGGADGRRISYYEIVDLYGQYRDITKKRWFAFDNFVVSENTGAKKMPIVIMNGKRKTDAEVQKDIDELVAIPQQQQEYHPQVMQVVRGNALEPNLHRKPDYDLAWRTQAVIA